MLTSIQALILEPGFSDSEAATETTAFFTNEAGGGLWGGVCPRKVPEGPALLQLHCSGGNYEVPLHRARSTMTATGDKQTLEAEKKPSCGGGETILRSHQPGRQS